MPFVPKTTLDSQSVAAEFKRVASSHKSATVAAIATADAGTQTGSYVQATVQSIATLANANKAKINEVIAALKTAGLMS